MDYTSFFVWVDGLSLIVPKPGEQSRLFAFIGPFQPSLMNALISTDSTEAFDRNSFRILAGFWLLGAMVLVNSYSGIVISSLTVPKMMPPIETLDDLAASKDVEIIVRHDTLIGEQILQAKTGVYKMLGDQARKQTDHILGDPFKVSAMLETGRYAYPFEMSTYQI
ncbi:hypothetical protein DAPPUDRAFT_258444 [Daphnia pulex]|uniref:Ionotropic glutamate receptor C-terminal domain-containing protein n=1 Tax=Daphnia pulex TaxID=6669 RepID=E9HFE7_DAPPU|nr:hypothetical protein DAPPUDRAFT_258444 [Daphnia pulex]|eukprot:EFX69521.1 hypothetical protein DAPPUDRAFT_258444 [Daphnia pulex]